MLVLTPILPGAEDALRELLDELPAGVESPLARLETTHFARWVVIDEIPYQGPPQKPDPLRSKYLLFSTTFDGSPDAYLDALSTRMAEDAHAIWGHCAGCPEPGDPPALRRYLDHNRLETSLPFAQYPGVTVAEIREALALRERFVAFVERAQGADAEELQRLFCELLAPEAVGKRLPA
jgi:hypothetical protein